MHVDGNELAPGTQLQAQVAVVGAGPAGIVLALELAKHGHSVLLMEAGRESGAAAHPPAEVVCDDPYHEPMALASQRQVGGASKLWGGRCVPFDPVDFVPREVVGDARWPLTHDDLEPYSQAVCDWLQCGPAVFAAGDLPALSDRTLVPGLADGDVRATSLERWSTPTRFGQVYGSALRQRRDIRLVTELNCVEVVCAPGGSTVDRLEAVTPRRARVTVRAAKYVIAGGGLESTRLLFASNRVHEKGLGNHSGHLGRWYMAHVQARIARVQFSTAPGSTIHSYERDDAGAYVRRRLTFSPDFLVEHGLPNCAMWIVNPPLLDAAHRNGFLSFVYLLLKTPLGRRLVAERIRQFHVDSGTPTSHRDHVRNVLRDLGPTARLAAGFGYQRYLTRGRKVPGFFVPSESNTYALNYHGEHLPSPDSYVTPSRERDALGVPRLRTHLSLSDRDIEGALSAHRYLDRHLRGQGLGHVEYVYDDPGAAVRASFVGGCHQAGTTRMSAAPGNGVVDRNLGVHGVRGLYVASSSTFVTSSQANPTFMIVALALRLAQHLRGELA